MSHLIRTEFAWLTRHATAENGQWVCKSTGIPIQQRLIGRSIWIAPFQGGQGEVRAVTHLWCPTCQPPPPISHGEPIYDHLLVEGDL